MIINLVLVALAILILGVVPYVYAHTPYYMKGYKLGRKDGKTGGGGYGSLECSVSMSNKSCSDYVTPATRPHVERIQMDVTTS